MTSMLQVRSGDDVRERQNFRAIRIADVGDMEFRSDGSKREFDGIALPWDVEIDVDGWSFESWARGAFNHQMRAASRIKVGYGHIPLGGDLIGRLKSMSDDAKGLRVSGKITAGVPEGDVAMALMEDRALDELSIGFWDVPGGASMTRDAQQRPHWRMSKADLFEIAIVPFGAYGRKATVDEVRQANPAQVRERIVAGGRVRQLTVSIDGQSLTLPFDGNIADAHRALSGAVAAPAASAPAPVETPAAVDYSEIDGILADLPKFELPAAE